MYTRTITFRSDELIDKEIQNIRKYMQQDLFRKRFTDSDIIKSAIDYLHAEIIIKSNKTDSS